MKQLQLVVLLLVVLSLSKEGACTHLETCKCHEISAIINAAVQEAVAGLEGKLNALIAENNEETAKSTQSETIKLPLSHHTVSNSVNNLATSCKAVKETYPDAPSGFYWVKAGDGASIRVYCDMTRSCGGITGGWMKVANLNMTDINQNCPNWGRFYTRRLPTGKRLCDIQDRSCASAKYSVHNIPYNHVCGRVIGYQFGVPRAFYYNHFGINDHYVFGVSLTHGSANYRHHIWTFAGSSDESRYNHTSKCPCINTNNYIYPESLNDTVRSFVGTDYFCDTALSKYYTFYRSQLHLGDPLWDGQGCGPTNVCCNFPSDQVKPPWFYKHLPQGTTDAIEMRLCKSNNEGSTPIEIVELYVQ